MYTHVQKFKNASGREVFVEVQWEEGGGNNDTHQVTWATTDQTDDMICRYV